MKTMSFDFKSRRSMVSARRGMVGASTRSPPKPVSTFCARAATQPTPLSPHQQ